MSVIPHPKERSTQLIWTGFILMFFVIQAILWTIAILFTMNDSSHAIIPNYEQKAVNWDQSQAARRASKALGIQSQFSIDADADVRGVRTVRLKLRDAAGKPISGDSLSLTAFHVGRAAIVQEVALLKTKDGDFTGSVKVDKTGKWSFTGSVLVGNDLFFVDERIFIEK